MTLTVVHQNGINRLHYHSALPQAVRLSNVLRASLLHASLLHASLLHASLLHASLLQRVNPMPFRYEKNTQSTKDTMCREGPF